MCDAISNAKNFKTQLRGFSQRDSKITSVMESHITKKSTLHRILPDGLLDGVVIRPRITDASNPIPHKDQIFRV